MFSDELTQFLIRKYFDLHLRAHNDIIYHLGPTRGGLITGNRSKWPKNLSIFDQKEPYRLGVSQPIPGQKGSKKPLIQY